MADIDLDLLVNDSTGTQIRDAFKAVGIELDEFTPPGASNPGVYNGVQIVDAFKAWNEANPGKIDMNTISTNMKGTQIIDAFKLMGVKKATIAGAAASNSAPASIKSKVGDGTLTVGSPGVLTDSSAIPEISAMHVHYPLSVMGAVPWTTGQYIIDGHAEKLYWDGAKWVMGIAP